MSKLLSALQQLEASGALATPPAEAPPESKDTGRSDAPVGRADQPAALPVTFEPIRETSAPEDLGLPEPCKVIAAPQPVAVPSKVEVVRETTPAAPTPVAEPIDLDALHSMVSEALVEPPAPAPKREPELKRDKQAGARSRPEPSTPGEMAVRRLRAHVLATIPAAGGASQIFVGPASSAAGAECVVDLAIALADSRLGEILVVDADLEAAGLAARFGLKTGPGLGDVLVSGQSWRTAVQKTSVAGVSFLAAGRPLFASFEAERSQIEFLLREMKQVYRLVLIQGGSIEQDHVLALARGSDGTYLLVEMGMTREGCARRAVRLLKHAGARVLGSVITGSQV